MVNKDKYNYGFAEIDHGLGTNVYPFQGKLNIYANSSKVQVRAVKDASEGLYAIQSINLTQPVCSVQGPVISALDTPRLKDSCYHCFAQYNDQGELDLSMGSMARAAAELPVTNAHHNLEICKGCNVVRYCRERCREESREQHHKLECPIYAALYPRILPNNVRAAIRWLLQKKEGLLSQTLISHVGALESHIDKLRTAGGKRWSDLIIMTQGVKEYSKTPESFTYVLNLICQMMINCFTLTTIWNDPIGLALHPLLAKMNHSCSPNAYIRFPIRAASDLLVVPLKKIKKDEQITIAYIDPNEFFIHRQRELQERYFFDCNCLRCKKIRQTEGNAQKERSKSIDELLKRIDQLVHQAETTTSNSARIQALRYAIFLLEDTRVWRMKQEPYPKLIHKLVLAYISAQQYNMAFAYASVQHFNIDPHVYKQKFHPIRITHTYVLIRLIVLVLDATEWESQELRLNEDTLNGLQLGWWYAGLKQQLLGDINKSCSSDLIPFVQRGRIPATSTLKDDQIEEVGQAMKDIISWAIERNKVWV